MSALAKNSTLQIGGKLFGTIFGLITFFLLLQYFGTDGYGLLTIAMTHVAIFGVIVDFGLTLTTTQMISERGADEEKILGNLLTLRVVSALAFLAVAPVTALFIPGVREVVLLVCIATGSSFFASVAQTYIGVFQKRLALGVPVMGEMLNRLIALAVVIGVGLAHLPIIYAAFGFFLGGFVQLSVMLLGTARYVRLRPRFEWRVWRDVLTRSWPIGISIFFNLLYLKGDILFMAAFGVTATEIGQYGSAYKVVDVTTMVPVTFMGIMLPILTMAWSEKNRDKFDKNLQNTFDIFALIAIPFAVGAIMLGVQVMTAVKPDLVLAGQVLAVLGPAAAVVFFNSLYGHAVVAVNKQRVMTLAYCLVAVIAIVGYVIYIPLYGAWAAAWVTLLSELLIGLCSFMVVTLAIKRLPNMKMTVRAVASTLIMAGAIALVQSQVGEDSNALITLATVLFGIAVYVLSVTIMGGPRPKTIAKLFLPEKPTGV